MRAHTHLISLQTTRTLRLRTASQPILTSLVPITTHAQVSAQGAFNKQILLTKATTTTNLEKTNCCSCYMNQLSLFSLYPCFQVYNFLPVVLGKFLKALPTPALALCHATCQMLGGQHSNQASPGIFECTQALRGEGWLSRNGTLAKKTKNHRTRMDWTGELGAGNEARKANC